MNDTKTRQCKTNPKLYVTVYLDGSGGYFSLKNLKPEPLIHLAPNERERIELNAEYDELLESIRL